MKLPKRYAPISPMWSFFLLFGVTLKVDDHLSKPDLKQTWSMSTLSVRYQGSIAAQKEIKKKKAKGCSFKIRGNFLRQRKISEM